MRRQVRVLAALALAAACKEPPKVSAPPTTGALGAPATKGAPAGTPFRVEAAPPAEPCAVEAPCTVAITLTATDGFHVNPDYPTKLVVTPVDGVTADGEGTFTRDGEAKGTLVWTFRAARTGVVRVAGAFRFSVCDPERCLIEERPIGLDVMVTPPGEEVPPHQTFTIPSKILGETRRINLYSPMICVAETVRCPVLYMPDGGIAEDFPHVARAIEAGIAAKTIRPVHLVGIENTERRRDLTGPTTVEEDKQIAPRVGGSAAFRAFLRDELFAEVDRRVNEDGTRGIIGESLAGLFVIETFLTEPALFDVYVAFSPSMQWNGGALARSTAPRLAAMKDVHATLYLAHAKDDNLDGHTGELALAIRRQKPKGVRFTFAPRLEETHATIYRAAEVEALRVVYPARR